MGAFEWGPWFAHEPGPCPEPGGTYMAVKAVTVDGSEIYAEGRVPAGGDRHRAWYVAKPAEGTARILEYRVRYPSGMVTLDALLQDVARCEEVTS